MTVEGVRVVVALVTPAQEQADEYRTVPEQAEAYVGTFVGAWVVAAQVPVEALVVLVKARVVRAFTSRFTTGKVGRGRMLTSRFAAPVTVSGLKLVSTTTAVDVWTMVSVASIVVTEVTVLTTVKN